MTTVSGARADRAGSASARHRCGADHTGRIARRSRGAALIAGLAITSLLSLAACSSSSKNSSSGSGTGGSTLTGSPIVIQAQSAVNSQLASLPQFLDVAQVYAKSINAAGGIGGHPLKITTCDNQAAPTQTVTCARQAVSDHAVAVVGFAIETPAMLKALSDAKIPFLNGVAHTPDALTNPISFPVTVGSTYSVLGQVALAAKEGCKTASLVTNEGFVAVAQLQQKLAAAQGITIKIVTYPTNASDAAPYVAKMAGSDCMMVGATSDQFVAQLGAALPQSGVKFAHIIAPPTLSTEIASKSPATWEGALIAGTVTDVATPPWAKFVAAVKAYSTVDQSKSPETLAQPVWVSMAVLGNVLRDVVQQKKDLTAASVLSALNATTSANSDGTGPRLDFTKNSSIQGAPRLFAPEVGFSTVKSGKVVPAFDGQYHNILPFITGQKNTDAFFKPAS
jgi:ABC-type branched-subunit amino acid transport system substrate-binding protein